MKSRRSQINGGVLILVLWALCFLTVLAVNIAVIVRGKINLVSRVERRAETKQMARAGVQRALAVLHSDKDLRGPEVGAIRKRLRHNNPEALCRVPVGRGQVDVTCEGFDGPGKMDVERCGFIDEEGKININRADRAILVGLIQEVLGFEKDKAGELAGAIIDWREFGESEVEGFQSDVYYDNLEFPYPEKKADYERLEELALLDGVNSEVYQALKKYLTVYGAGRVNLNTARPPVLLAIGFRPEVVATTVMVRNGPDKMEATADDVFFQSGDDFLALVGQFMRLNEADTAKVKELEARGLLGVESKIFRVQSRGQLGEGPSRAVIDCVVDSATNKILSWHEKGES